MNNIYVENKNNLAVYFELLFKACDIYAQYEEQAKILFMPEIEKNEYEKLLLCAAQLDTIMNDLSAMKELINFEHFNKECQMLLN